MDVIDRFFSTADSNSGKAAVITRTGATSYSELAVLVKQFATRFSTVGSPKVLVAYNQGPHAYAAMLGTMLAGGYYVPVNVSAPAEKIAAICKTFGPHFVASDDLELTSLPALCSPPACVRSSEVELLLPSSSSCARNAIAYVIFTSGSTGKPKGVVISHGALAHYIDWVIDSDVFATTDVVSQYSNIAFDLSVLEIYGALCAGATLVPFTSRSERLMPAGTIKARGVSVWVSVPSVISLVARAGQLNADNLGAVRRYFFCGEPLLDIHMRGIFAACPEAEIWNSYGPTETTVSMTYLKLDSKSYMSAVKSSVALGDAIPGMGIHLIGGESVESGEIVITGPQLAEGYWDAPDQTSRAFRDLQVDGVHRRAYFSGDWAHFADGNLYFENRVDQQVKIHGFRVELSEVASAIRSLGWEEVVVLKLNDDLVAVLEDKGATRDINCAEIHARLWEKLDHYAVPAHLVVVEALPRNENDKIDLQAAAALAKERIHKR